jgi:hypothetical protein
VGLATAAPVAVAAVWLGWLPLVLAFLAAVGVAFGLLRADDPARLLAISTGRGKMESD